MYHVSAQGVDERMINVHYYYYYSFVSPLLFLTVPALRDLFYREGTDGLYASQTFLLAYTLHTLPFSAVTSVIFSALLYWSVQLSTLLVSTAFHSTGQYRAPVYLSVQLSTLLVSMALHFIDQYSSPLHWSVNARVSTLLVSTAPHSTGQYSTPLYWSVQLSSLLVGTAHNQTLLC